MIDKMTLALSFSLRAYLFWLLVALSPLKAVDTFAVFPHLRSSELLLFSPRYAWYLLAASIAGIIKQDYSAF